MPANENLPIGVSAIRTAKSYRPGRGVFSLDLDVVGGGELWLPWAERRREDPDVKKIELTSESIARVR